MFSDVFNCILLSYYHVDFAWICSLKTVYLSKFTVMIHSLKLVKCYIKIISSHKHGYE